MSFNFNVFGAVTGGLGFLLAILQYLLFVTFRPSRVLRALEESLDSLQNVLVDVQRDGIPDDDFSLGWAGAQTRLDHYRTRTRMLRCEVNSLASVTSEINAIMCGLTCKLFSLRRKTYSLLAEVAVAELFERQRQEDHMLDNQFSVRVFGATAMSAAEAEHYEASVNTARPMYTVRNRRVASYASAEAIGGNIDPSNASLYYRTREAGCSSVMNSISSESATAGTAADEAAPIAHTRHKNKPIGVLHLDQGLSTRVAIGVSTGHNESTEMGVRLTSSGESVPRGDDVPEDSSPLASGSSQNSMFLPGDAATASIEASPSEPQHVFTDSIFNVESLFSPGTTYLRQDRHGQTHLTAIPILLLTSDMIGPLTQTRTSEAPSARASGRQGRLPSPSVRGIMEYSGRRSSTTDARGSLSSRAVS